MDENLNKKIRLQKHIASLGYCSRRKAEGLILKGKVKINGKIITELGTKVDPKTDKIEVFGEIKEKNNFVYIALNKPIGYITSSTSEQGKSIMELITQDNNIKKMPVPKERVYPVGRLDKESEGLIIMTNDGDLANMLMHPKFEHEKEYEVTIHEKLLPPAQTALEKGLLIEKEFYGGLKIKNIINKGKVCLITVILKQGKNRQIRKMFEALGYRVANLKRTRVAKLQLWTLPAGKWKYIDKKDI